MPDRYGEVHTLHESMDQSEREGILGYFVAVLEANGLTNVTGELSQDAYSKQWYAIVKGDEEVEQ